MELGLLTSLEFPLPPAESVLLEKFSQKGVQTRQVPWETFDFERGPKQILIRTPWNYFVLMDRFRVFLKTAAEHKIQLINDISTVL